MRTGGYRGDRTEGQQLGVCFSSGTLRSLNDHVVFSIERRQTPEIRGFEGVLEVLPVGPLFWQSVAREEAGQALSRALGIRLEHGMGRVGQNEVLRLR